MAHLCKLLLSLGTTIMIASAVMAQVPPAVQRTNMSDPLSWSRFTVEQEEFSIRLPTMPSMTTTKVFDPRVRKKRTERQLKISFEGVVYTIDVFENLKPRQSLAEFVNGQNTGSMFDLTTERTLTVEGVAGKEYSIRNQASPATVQLFVTNRRLYRFNASGRGAEHPGVKEFFGSIRLGKNVFGQEVTDGPGMPLESDTGDRIYLAKEVDIKLRIIRKFEPSYTPEARLAQTSGTVVLRAVFKKTGEVDNIQVLRGLPNGLTDQAITALRSTRFTPAEKEGKYVSIWMQLEYNFNLY